MGATIGQVTVTAASEGQSGTALLTSDTGVLFDTVSLGNNHTCASTSGGFAYCWGNNSSGQLGNGTGIKSAAPVLVASFPLSSISAGGDHACAIGPGGAAACWGDNSSGELGNGTTTTSLTPVPVSGGHSFTMVSAGAHHTCGLTSQGTAYCWGNNSFGQLGNGTYTSSAVPVPIPYPVANASWNQVSAGSTHTCASLIVSAVPMPTISIYCWGDNSAGQFGDGTMKSSNVPVPTSLPATVAISPSTVSAGTQYSCFFLAVFSSSCAGNNSQGQLGNGTTTSSSLPVTISTQQHLSSISAGLDHACGVDGSGNAYCWGNNSLGQLGNGTNMNSATPITVAGGLNWATVVAGGGHTCGITGSTGPTAGGGVYCWGDNTYGQLGNTWTTSSSVPINVTGYTR